MKINEGINVLAFSFDCILAKAFKILKKEGIIKNINYILANNGLYKLCSKTLDNNDTLFLLKELLEEASKLKSTQVDDKFFRYLDSKYKLSKAFYADRVRYKIDFEEYKILIKKFVSLVKDILIEKKIDALILEGAETSWDLLTYFVAKELNIKTLVIVFSSLENRFIITDNVFHQLKETCLLFKKLKQNKCLQILQKYKPYAEKIIISLREEREKTYKDIGGTIINKQYTLLRNPLDFLNFLKKYSLYYRGNYMISSPLERLKENFIYTYRKLYITNFFHIKNLDSLPENFILYPLQLYPEATTLVVSPYDQLCIIKEIAKKIPIDWYLVIKEHPSAVGIRPLSFYKELEQFPNVLIADYKLNLLELIKKSRIVFSLNGTPILEALLLKKPVIFTGPSKYDCFNLGIKSTDILRFDFLIDQALNKKISDTDLIYMLVSFLATSYEFSLLPTVTNPDVLREENILKIAKALKEAILTQNKVCL